MSLGTSGTLFGTSNVPLLDSSGTVAPFCDATGRWLPLLCTQNCTNLTEEVLEPRNILDPVSLDVLHDCRRGRYKRIDRGLLYSTCIMISARKQERLV